MGKSLVCGRFGRRGGVRVTSRLSRIEFILPRWDEGEMEPGFKGVAEIGAFCRTGDPKHLPEYPSVGMALEWIIRIARDIGFERELARLGTDHQKVMDRVFMPAENGNYSHLSKTHPLILMHCLWRMSVEYGRQHCPDMTFLISGEGVVPTRQFWAAFVERVNEENAMLAFLPSGTRPEWGREVQLGNPNLKVDPREMSPGIAKVLTQADFSELPENPTWKEISDLALIIEGYTLGESLPEVGDLFEWFNPLWEAHLDKGEAFPHSSAHLWLMLFCCQRGYLRNLHFDFPGNFGRGKYGRSIRKLYRAFRMAAQDEQLHTDASTPVYLQLIT